MSACNPIQQAMDRTLGISNTSQYCKGMYSRNVEAETQKATFPATPAAYRHLLHSLRYQS